jgi:hypothetical protein
VGDYRSDEVGRPRNGKYKIEATDNPPKNPTEQEAAQARSPHVPLKVPWLKLEDVAPVAVFLASDLVAMVTGLATMPLAATPITSRKRTPSCAIQVSVLRLIRLRETLIS